MHILNSNNSIILWQEVIKDAEGTCCVSLNSELETYLVWLLHRYTGKPEIIRQVFATAFLEALQLGTHQRHFSLQQVGDQCLLYVGLFPHAPERRPVKLKYFVDLGKAAYFGVSQKENDIYGTLSSQFVRLMDVLQSIRQPDQLLPLEAYDQWHELGSERARRILASFTQFNRKD